MGTVGFGHRPRRCANPQRHGRARTEPSRPSTWTSSGSPHGRGSTRWGRANGVDGHRHADLAARVLRGSSVSRQSGANHRGGAWRCKRAPHARTNARPEVRHGSAEGIRRPPSTRRSATARASSSPPLPTVSSSARRPPCSPRSASSRGVQGRGQSGRTRRGCRYASLQRCGPARPARRSRETRGAPGAPHAGGSPLQVEHTIPLTVERGRITRDDVPDRRKGWSRLDRPAISALIRDLSTNPQHRPEPAVAARSRAAAARARRRRVKTEAPLAVGGSSREERRAGPSGPRSTASSRSSPIHPQGARPSTEPGSAKRSSSSGAKDGRARPRPTRRPRGAAAARRPRRAEPARPRVGPALGRTAHPADAPAPVTGTPRDGFIPARGDGQAPRWRRGRRSKAHRRVRGATLATAPGVRANGGPSPCSRQTGSSTRRCPERRKRDLLGQWYEASMASRPQELARPSKEVRPRLLRLTDAAAAGRVVRRHPGDRAGPASTSGPCDLAVRKATSGNCFQGLGRRHAHAARNWSQRCTGTAGKPA